MRLLLPEWQTVPFLAIWVSLTLVYAFRLWPLQPALLTLAVVTLATGGIIGAQVVRGQQDADYLVLVPLGRGDVPGDGLARTAAACGA